MLIAASLILLPLLSKGEVTLTETTHDFTNGNPDEPMEINTYGQSTATRYRFRSPEGISMVAGFCNFTFPRTYKRDDCQKHFVRIPIEGKKPSYMRCTDKGEFEVRSMRNSFELEVFHESNVEIGVHCTLQAVCHKVLDPADTVRTRMVKGMTLDKAYVFPFYAGFTGRSASGSAGTVRFGCTCSIVDRYYILTARHCVYRTPEKEWVQYENITVNQPLLADQCADNWVTHRKVGVDFRYQQQLSSDLALIRIKDPLPRHLAAPFQESQLPDGTRVSVTANGSPNFKLTWNIGIVKKQEDTWGAVRGFPTKMINARESQVRGGDSGSPLGYFDPMKGWRIAGACVLSSEDPDGIPVAVWSNVSREISALLEDKKNMDFAHVRKSLDPLF